MNPKNSRNNLIAPKVFERRLNEDKKRFENRLKIILPIGLGLILVTAMGSYWTHKDAENLLENERLITAARNQQIISQQEADKDFEREREQAERDFYFKNFLGSER